MRSTAYVLGVIASCGGSGPSDNPRDAAFHTDGPPGCAAAGAYSDFGSNVRGYAIDYPEHTTGSGMVTHSQVMVQTLNSTDVVFLQLEAAFGGFGSGDIKPGTYVLAGDDLNPASCGLCFFVWPHALSGTSLAAVTPAYRMTEQYMAVSGSVTLTQAGGSAGSGSGHQIAGSVSNVTFKHATIASDGSLTYAADGCTTSVGSGGFGYYNLQMGSAAFAPDMEIHANGFDMPSDVVRLRHRAAE